MALVRFDSTREVDSLQSEVNQIFDTFFGNGASGAGGRPRRWVPAMDLFETEDDLILKADLPGLSRDDVNIEFKDNTLTISGERRDERERGSEGFYRIERSLGSFARSVTLPQGIRGDEIAAEFSEGVLEVRVPKPEEQRPHRVQIGAAAVDGSATDQSDG